MNEHQWWCGGKEPCACTEAWKQKTWANDLIAFKWVETLSQGEQSVLLSGNLKHLQERINQALQQAITDERARAARIIREHRESDKCEGSCWAIITEAICRDDTGEEGS
jgi:hypothetical protein